MPLTPLGLGCVYGTNTVLQAAAVAFIESISFTPKYGGPVVEVEDTDGASRAMALLDDGGNIELSAVYENNASTTNLAALTIGSKVICKILGVNGGNNINCYVVATPRVNYARKTEIKCSFSLIYRPMIP